MIESGHFQYHIVVEPQVAYSKILTRGRKILNALISSLHDLLKQYNLSILKSGWITIEGKKSNVLFYKVNGTILDVDKEILSHRLSKIAGIEKVKLIQITQVDNID